MTVGPGGVVLLPKALILFVVAVEAVQGTLKLLGELWLAALPDLSAGATPEPKRCPRQGRAIRGARLCTGLCQKDIREGGKASADVRIVDTGCHLDESPENKGKTELSAMKT